MRKTLAGAIALGTVLGAPAVGDAMPPQRGTETFTVDGPLVACSDFDVVGHLRGTSTVTDHDGIVRIRLRLTGTLENSVTGLTGRYAEIQVDAQTRAGSEFSAGLLSKFTVPGRGTAALSAGRGGITADGDAFLTPGAAGVEDADAFVADICSRLA